MELGLIACCLAFFALSCGGTAAEGADPATADSGDSLGDGAETSFNCPGVAGCPCVTNDDCPAQSACTPRPEGNTCALPCVAGQCGADEVCSTVLKTDAAGAPVQVQDLCVHMWPKACDPCATSDKCASTIDPQAACVDLQGGQGANGWFCAPSCGAGGACPNGYACKSVTKAEGGDLERCVPVSGLCACSPSAIAAGLGTSCKPGACPGERVCTVDGLTACAVTSGSAPELCDGQDNDCDGLTDESKEPDDGPTPAACISDDPCYTATCGGAAGCLKTAITALCDDGDACTQGDGCVEGKCTGQAVPCSDGNPCTTDSCVPADGCTFLPATGACDDSDPCTQDDACTNGNCEGTPLTCDDGNPCTTDACEGAQGCVSTSTQAPCDDGDPCTKGDTCNVQGTCAGTTATCDDGNPCTKDTCVDGLGCESAPSQQTCDDGNVCTVGDTCAQGSCVGTPQDCDDGLGCTTDACDPGKGCVFTKLTETCGVGVLPFAENFSCDSKGFGQWQLSGGGKPPAGAPPVRWQLAQLPTELATDPTSCTLGVHNGLDLTCGAGQAAVTATADSPQIDATKIPAGSPVFLRFESAGSWGSGATAQVQIAIGGGTWTTLGNLPASGAVWGKAQLGLGVVAGKTFQLRLRFTIPSCEQKVPGYGWFVRSLVVFQDVCAVGNGGCDGYATCAIGPVGKKVCTCNAGWSGDGLTCADLDECKAGTADCATQATCANEEGSYTCTCNSGWTGDGKTCADADECANGTAGCSANAACSNSPGSFTCKCKDGFTGDGKTCSDVDECSNGTAGCSTNATCTNSPGSFTCKCKEGFAGDGKTCTPTTAATCVQYKQNYPSAGSGVYPIDVDGAGPKPTVQAYCDMATTGGPYTWVRINNGGLGGDQNAYANLCNSYGMEIVVPRNQAHAFAIRSQNGGQVPNVINVFPKYNGANGLGNWQGICKGAPCGFWISNSNNANCSGYEPNGDNNTSYRLYSYTGSSGNCDYGQWNDASNAMAVGGWVICSTNDR
jgi:hypothetical protein